MVVLHQKHLQEWLDSAVDRKIAELNAISLEGFAPLEYLLHAISDSERRNDGRLKAQWLKRYSHCYDGGWWCSGIDVLTGLPSNWGQFKPDKPYSYIDSKQGTENKGFGNEPLSKIVKYEPPRKVATEIYALRVPLHIWQRIAEYNNQPMPDNIVVDEKTGEALGFWSWVLSNSEIPVTITEGAKKAGALLTVGYCAIALPGIWNGRRQPVDSFGHKTGLAFLIPQLKAFAANGREINFCFDNDPKPKTRTSVKKAICLTGKLFEKFGCKVKVVSWIEPDKGVDDFIAAHGVEVFKKVYNNRKPFSSFKLLDILDISPFVSQKINERYLGAGLVPPIDAQIIGIKSAKNTAKSTWLTIQVEMAKAQGRPVVVITHRIELARELADRFNIPHIEKIHASANNGQSGYALCIDSLHADSKANFDPSEWSQATIIIDEAEQVFWHALNSSTLQSNRVRVLENFSDLIKVAIATGGKIYLADADLSPIAIKYVQSLATHPVKTWVVENLYNPNLGKRKLITYTGSDPRKLAAACVDAIKRGEKVIIHTSGQKEGSKWGSRNLERYLFKKFKSFGKRVDILRIDAESVSDPDHEAYCCTKNLNGLIQQYDVVIASPTIETGVSIDLLGYFDSVWCIAWGVSTVDAVCQTVERLRDDVPRHIWAKQKGLSFVGNGSTDIKRLLRSTHKQTRANITYLEAAGFSDFSNLDWSWQNAHLTTWAFRAAVVNAGMHAYRESILKKLEAEGYEVVTPNCDAFSARVANAVKEEIYDCSAVGYKAHCVEVSKSENLTNDEIENLSQKHNKTKAERNAIKKGQLASRYGVEVTPELVEKDDRSWYAKLRLHYYLTIGNQFSAHRDASKLASLTKDTGKAFKPDVNKQQILLKVNGLKLLRLEMFLEPGKEFSNETLGWWWKLISTPLPLSQIKELYGISINPETTTPIGAANRLLKLMGLKLVKERFTGGRKNKHRVYKLISLNHDGRAEIYLKWLERDINYSANPNVNLYVGELMNVNSMATSKILLEIAASGGKYARSQRPPTQKDYSIEECSWLLEQVQKLLASSLGALSGWLDFFKGVGTAFKDATWKYVSRTFGIDFKRELVKALFELGGDPALEAVGVEF
ncbi:MAG: DUF3854 domain-containing protein [Prochloraceae cyanobacterium]|nr:DUF3854 domain-containing protein [Prochloraceae cyanobacterium]